MNRIPTTRTRTLRLSALTLASVLALMPLASAQTASAQTSSAQTTGTPALTTQRSNTQQPGTMRPGRSASFTLVRKVATLNALGRDPGTALSREQAGRLAALLSPLKTAKTLTTAQAGSLSASIDRLLTPTQRSALTQDGGRMQGRPRQGQPGGQDQPNGQRPPTGQGQTAGQGGPMQNGMAGMAPDSNPFLNGRGSRILNALLGQLQK